MNNTLHFIDANVPMYAVGEAHPLKQPCLTILDAIADGSLAAMTSVEVHQEILHRYTALGRRERAIEVVQLFLDVIPAPVSITLPDIMATLLIHTRYNLRESRDAVHLAVMQNHGVTHIITADQHFDSIPGITRVDPSQWAVQSSR